MSERAVFWRDVVERQGRSGWLVADFCRREGVSTASFYNWQRRPGNRQQHRRAGDEDPRTRPQELAVRGRRAAILLSLVASAKANQVEPWAWQRDLFTHLPTTPATGLDHLLPDRWLATHPQHRWHIDDRRHQHRHD